MLHEKLVKEIKRCQILMKDAIALGKEEWVRQGRPVEQYFLQPLHPVLQQVHDRLSFATMAESTKDEKLMAMAVERLEQIAGGWTFEPGAKQ